MSRARPLLVLLAVCLTPCLRAQTAADRPTADSTDVLVLDHNFSALGEPVRVFLQGGQVYRAELSSPDVILQIRGLVQGVVRPTQLPRIYPFLSSETPSGTSIAEIYPEIDADYEIRAVVLGGRSFATRLRLYRDIRASARRHRVRQKSGWDIGIELAAGWHSGYWQSSAPPPTGASPAGGTDIESCFSARPRGGSGLCVVGLSYQSQSGAKNILWLYTEPRLRVLGRGRPVRSTWELGAMFRFGVGMISASSSTPVTLAPGVYLTRNLGSNGPGRRWNLQASYRRHFFFGFGSPTGVPGTVHPSSNQLSFGIGWYQ
jgi:hypothetical protein